MSESDIDFDAGVRRIQELRAELASLRSDSRACSEHEEEMHLPPAAAQL